MPDFQALELKHYPRWTLFLAGNQYYLGRACVWLGRNGSMQRLSTLTALELMELQEIMLEYEAVLAACWAPDHMNYAWLGNEFHSHRGHGHMHLIPRYKSARVMAGRTFTDRRWGRNYAPYPKQTYKTEALFAIRDKIKEHF